MARSGPFPILLAGALLGLAGWGCFGSPPPKLTNWAVLQKDNPWWKKAAIEVQLSPPRLDQPDLPPLRQGSGREKTLALTFDDGPHYLFTPRALDILKEEGVRACFFVTGRMAERHPDLIQRIAAEGHELGNHSFSHASLAPLSPSKVEIEYRAADDVVRAISGVKMKWARPPGGAMNPHVTEAAEANGLTTVLWTHSPKDYQRPKPEVLIKRVLDRLEPGGILLLHDGPPTTLAALPELIREIRARGYRFVSLSELQAENAPGDEASRRR